MKIRIGVGAAGASSTPEALADLVTSIDDLGFDSLWLSEVLTGPVIDPVVGLAWAAASNSSGLVLPPGTGKAMPSRAELITGIIEAAKHYDVDVSAQGWQDLGKPA